MFRRAPIALLLLHLISSPALALPDPASSRTVFLEGCDLSLALEENLVPVEIQADSFLGVYSTDHVSVALVCRPNPRRTFEPGEGTPKEQSLRTKKDDQPSASLFWTASSESTDVPFPGIHSWSLRWATRSHLFHLMVYTDPTSPNKGRPINNAIGSPHERLEHIATCLILHEAGEPAILESTYRQRLWATGTFLVLLLSGAGLILFVRIRRR